jgi:hypothetical protein
LGSVLIFCYSTGTLLGYVLGSYASYRIFPWIMMPLLAVFLIVVIFLPDTPYYYIKKDREEVIIIKCNPQSFFKQLTDLISGSRKLPNFLQRLIIFQRRTSKYQGSSTQIFGIISYIYQRSE